MKNKKLLPLLMIGFLSATALHCSEQILTPAQMRQDIIDNTMKPENFSNLKHNFAFLESQGLLQPNSFLSLLQENITESPDATFNEVIEKAEDLLTEHMNDPFILIIKRALTENNSLDYYVDTLTSPLFTYVMQRKDDDRALHNIVGAWLLAWSSQVMNLGYTPLYVAAQTGHIEIVQFLVGHGINVDIQMINGSTPLHIAAQNGHIEIVKFLLKHCRASVDIQVNLDGSTALYIAAYHCHAEIVKLLLMAGANVNSQKNDGSASLHVAAFNGSTEIARLLLEAGANVDIQTTHDGVSPLFVVVQQGHTDILQLLVERGANVDIQTADDEAVPLHIAAFNGHTEITRLLLAAGANGNIQTTEGITPLHFAVLRGYTEIVQLLVYHGADVNIRNYDGQIAEDLAETDEMRDILRRAQQGNSQSETGWCSIS